jgi:hypothetical protein
MSETLNPRIEAQDFQSYRGVIEAKPKKPVEELNRFVPYILGLKRDQLKEVLPVFVAAIKKNPDDAISTFVHFLAHAKFDASPFLADFFHVLKEHLQSKYEAVARDALLSFQLLARSVRDGAVLALVAGELVKVPSGSLPAARRLWADALLELGRTVIGIRFFSLLLLYFSFFSLLLSSFLSFFLFLSLFRDGSPLGASPHLADVPVKLLKEIVDKVVPLVKKETNQDTLQSLLLCLGWWLAHSQGSPCWVWLSCFLFVCLFVCLLFFWFGLVWFFVS